MFVRERYFVTVNNLSGADGWAADAGEVRTRGRRRRCRPIACPPNSRACPPQGMVAGSERLVRGPFGLQSIFTLGDGDVLQLGGRIVGVAEDVRDGERRADATGGRLPGRRRRGARVREPAAAPRLVPQAA